MSFTNSLGLNEDGNCCNGIKQSSGTCSSTCRTFFRVCLKHYQNDIKTDTPCTFGTITSPVIGNNSFNVPDILQSFTNPVKLPFDFAWPVSIQFLVEHYLSNVSVYSVYHCTCIQGWACNSGTFPCMELGYSCQRYVDISCILSNLLAWHICLWHWQFKMCLLLRAL